MRSFGVYFKKSVLEFTHQLKLLLMRCWKTMKYPLNQI